MHGFLKGMLLSGLALGWMGCGPKTTEDRASLKRAAVAPAPESGWARVVLSREAQQGFPDLWIGEPGGASVPFLVERDGLWAPRDLRLSNLLLGRDASGRPTAEFTLALPETWQVRDREHLHLRLDLEGAAPWVARVEVQRRLGEGPGVTLERDEPLHVFDLGEAGRRTEVVIPWDALHHRITLVTLQGAAPRFKGLSARAATEPSLRAEDQLETPRLAAEADGSWTLDLDGPDRIVGAEVALKPPVAPVSPRFSVPPEPAPQGQPEGYARAVSDSGLLWNLPALGSSATRVSLEPVTTSRLRLHLPEGAQVASVKLLVRRDALLFPAEAGKAYSLHWGGRVKPAPGNLSALPDSSRALYQQAPLAVGPAEADPTGLPRSVPQEDPLRRWLPWIAGAAVLGLGALALRLLRER